MLPVSARALVIATLLAPSGGDAVARTAREPGLATPSRPAPRRPSPHATPAGGTTLSVTVNPAGTVSVDGGPEMDSPIVGLRIAPGRHVVRVSNASHSEARTARIVVRPGERFALIIDIGT